MWAAVKEGLLFELEQMKAGASAAELEKIQAALKNLKSAPKTFRWNRNPTGAHRALFK